MTTTTRSTECTAITTFLFLARELVSKTGKLAIALAHGSAPRTRTSYQGRQDRKGPDWRLNPGGN